MIEIYSVDDDGANREIIAELIKLAGFSYDEAENGEQACDLASSNQYDVIFMDIMMPVMDGVTATHNIRQNNTQESAPKIVAVTAKRNKLPGEGGIGGTGFDDVVRKPFTEDQILSHLP